MRTVKHLLLGLAPGILQGFSCLPG